MRAAILTSTELRHRYFVEAMRRSFTVCTVLTQAKSNYYSKQRSSSEFVRAHFDRLKCEEVSCFGDVDKHGKAQTAELIEDINDLKHIKRVIAEKPDVILLFGTSILRSHWLEAFPGRIVNLHLGLSPFYRGSATLFWPFYYQEVECVGTTVHLASERVDAGNILSRTKPDLISGDDYYAITMRLIRKSIDAVPSVTIDYLDGRVEPKPQEGVEGRLCRRADFTEAAVQHVLRYVGPGLRPEEIERIKRSERCRCSQ